MIVSSPCIVCGKESGVLKPPVTALLDGILSAEDEAILKQIQEGFGNSLEALNDEDKAGIATYLVLGAVKNFFICDIAVSDKADELIELAYDLSSDIKLKFAEEIIQSLRFSHYKHDHK